LGGFLGITTRVLCAALLLALGSAHAASPNWEGAWESADTALLAGALTGLVLDWSQTRKLTYVSEHTHTSTVVAGSRRPFGLPAAPEQRTGAQVSVSQQRWRPHTEGNPLLGSEPSNAEISRYFITTIGATVGLAYVLPKEWRRLFLSGVIVTQTIVVTDNHTRLGLRLNY